MPRIQPAQSGASTSRHVCLDGVVPTSLSYPVHERTLPNGLRVVVSPDHSVPVVAVIGGVRHEIAARAAVETEAEVALLEAGGAVPFILDRTERAAAVPASGAGASEVIEQGNHDGNDG